MKILRLYKKLAIYDEQFGRIDGANNIWIVKPSYTARGHGIYITDKMKDIIGNKKLTQSKVVQKYIEKPFLINERKFDVR